MDEVGIKKNDVEISVIMGVYNPTDKGQFFQAIQSIVDQSFTSWELILRDDGSDEKYRELIDSCALLDERIIIKRNNNNRGLAYTLNRCIEDSKGNYIARMDADDISNPQRFDTQYSFLESNTEYQWVGSNAYYIDDNGIWGNYITEEKPNKKSFLKHSPFIHPSVMFRREILIKNGGYSESFLTARCEDYELFMRLYSKGYLGYNIQEYLLKYREDLLSYGRRKFKFYFREAKIRYKWFKKLKILNVGTFPYLIKPLVTGIFPKGLRNKLKVKRVGDENV